MKAWVIVSGDIGSRGGQDKANLALATYLADRGDEVHLVAHVVDPALRSKAGIVIHKVARPLRSHLAGQPLLDRAGRLVATRVCRQAPGARVVVNGGNCSWFDVNWVHFVHNAWSASAAHAPIVHRLKRVIGGALDRHWEKDALTRARLVITNSKRTRSDVLRLGVAPDLVRVQYLGCDPLVFGPVAPEERLAARQRFGLDADEAAVVFVGALGHDCRKGFDTLLEAWHRLSATSRWRAQLLAAGAGPVSHWQREAAKRGLSRTVHLLGQTADIPELLAAADVLASPARYEPYGLNVQEALCRGVPAIVSASAGVAERYGPEMVDLLLPDPEDPADLARRLLAWHASRDRYTAMAEGLGTALRAFTWQAMAMEFVALVEASQA